MQRDWGESYGDVPDATHINDGHTYSDVATKEYLLFKDSEKTGKDKCILYDVRCVV